MIYSAGFVPHPLYAVGLSDSTLPIVAVGTPALSLAHAAVVVFVVVVAVVAVENVAWLWKLAL